MSKPDPAPSPSQEKPAKKKRLTSEERFKRLLSHVCAYCGRTKDERPPEWCVRAHEGWEASMREVSR